MGIWSVVRCGLPICLPLALAFAIPERTLARIIASSSCLNTPGICKNASVIGSACPLRQSIVILPTMTRHRCFRLMASMISQSCFVLLARRETSSVMMVSPACACSRSKDNCSLMTASPCSYSRYTVSAPACFSSRTCRSMSCLLSLVEHAAGENVQKNFYISITAGSEQMGVCCDPATGLRYLAAWG